MKMKFSAAVAAMAATCALAISCSAMAQAGSARAPAEGSDRYGSPAGDMPYDREIRLGSSSRGVSVARDETIKFVTAEGREFRWRFDTFAQFEVFPISRIAPSGVAVPAGTSVYVNGDIPIAP